MLQKPETDGTEEYAFNVSFKSDNIIKEEPDILSNYSNSSKIEDSTVFTLTFPEIPTNGGTVTDQIYIIEENYIIFEDRF